MDTNEVKCAFCHGNQWHICVDVAKCTRCGVSYYVKGITLLPMALIPITVPSPELLNALRIIDGQEK